ncbi:hypothetical protein [Frankia sp. CiP1_Cm_nod2]|uniref:hypothetical protein n=1 Tax=Frankia sp. CiP1_Cm_nod2 TaxID=2897161 RepID=UPI0020244742
MIVMVNRGTHRVAETRPLSVSSWKTGLDDAALTADVILECAARVSAAGREA